MNHKIELWEKYSLTHWLRKHGKTQIIIIDDDFYSKSNYLATPADLSEIESYLNVEFHFFSPDKEQKWNESWFKNELHKAKVKCKSPAVILLDLMFGEDAVAQECSGIEFLGYLANDDTFADIPRIVVSSEGQEAGLIRALKKAGTIKDYLEKESEKQKFSDRLLEKLLSHALISDPNIHAYSVKMRKVARKLRYILFKNELAELEDKFINIEHSIPRSVIFEAESGEGKNFLASYLFSISERGQRGETISHVTFTDQSDKDALVGELFGCGNATGVNSSCCIDIETGEVVNTTQKKSSPKFRAMTEPGIVALAKGGAVLLDELGHCPDSIKTILIRFLTSRTCKPRFFSQYVPTQRPFDVWVIMTKQPSHTMPDSRRIDQMERVYIPSFRERAAFEAIPHALDVLGAMKFDSADIEEYFLDDAISYLEKATIHLNTDQYRSGIKNLKNYSEKKPYNLEEVKEAFSEIGLNGKQVIQNRTNNAQANIQAIPPSNDNEIKLDQLINDIKSYEPKGIEIVGRYEDIRQAFETLLLDCIFHLYESFGSLPSSNKSAGSKFMKEFTKLKNENGIDTPMETTPGAFLNLIAGIGLMNRSDKKQLHVGNLINSSKYSSMLKEFPPNRTRNKKSTRMV